MGWWDRLWGFFEGPTKISGVGLPRKLPAATNKEHDDKAKGARSTAY
jgi:hypothetical protein